MALRPSTPEFEGKKEPVPRVFTQSILTNFREDEREEAREEARRSR